MTRPPHRQDLLFKNLFEGRPPGESFGLIAEGQSASLRNAERLLTDVKLLVDRGRFASARFLLATAREEIAKPYILADMCRLDLKRHVPVLRCLCKAFYDHVSKHAYTKLHDLSYIDSMADAKEIWETETQRWWPGEEGEPDMPHATVFDREFPLYTDFGDYDQMWLVPSDLDEASHFDPSGWAGGAPILQAEKLIDKWRRAENNGLCSPQVLTILNEVFKSHYLREDTTRVQLNMLYEQVARRVATETGIAEATFLASPIAIWPLYSFVSNC